MPFASTNPREQNAHFFEEARRRTQRPLDTADAAAFWRDETWRAVRAAPLASLRHLATKALATVHRAERGDHFDIGLVAEDVPVLRLPLPGFALAWCLAVLGAAERLRRRDPRALIVALGALGWLAMIALFFANGRYRAPAIPLLLPLAAAGLLFVVEGVRRRGLPRVPVALAAIAAVSCVLPLPGAADRTGLLNTHAAVLAFAGERARAVEAWRRAADADGAFSIYAQMSLAAIAPEAEQLAALVGIEEGRGPLGHAEAPFFAAKARLLARHGRIDDARTALARSLAVNPHQLLEHRRMIGILEALPASDAVARELEQERATVRRLEAVYAREAPHFPLGAAEALNERP